MTINASRGMRMIALRSMPARIPPPTITIVTSMKRISQATVSKPVEARSNRSDGSPAKPTASECHAYRSVHPAITA